MSDLPLEAWLIASFSQFAIDDGDKDGTSFEGIGKSGIELSCRLGLGLDLEPPCGNVLEGVSDGSKLDGSELNVESNTAVAVTDFIQLLGDLGNASNNGQHSADTANDFHPILVAVVESLARGLIQLIANPDESKRRRQNVNQAAMLFHFSS